MVTQHADYPSFKYWLPSKYALWRAEAIVVPSKAHIALSRELRGFEDKVEVIPFGIDERRWELVPPPPPGNPPRALFIGRLLAYKGVDFLLRALELVPELRLDVVGSGPELHRLRTLARALAVEDRVKWWGEYPDEDLPRRMADADFLVLPSVSVQEMFGMVLLEAMAAGRPVITTAVPSGVREVNVAGITGLEVPIRDVEALAEAMRTLAGRCHASASDSAGQGGSGCANDSPSRRWWTRTSTSIVASEAPRHQVGTRIVENHPFLTKFDGGGGIARSECGKQCS